MRTLLVPVVAVAALLSASPVHATAFCEIKPTSDGFVALRAGPSPNARLLVRMRPGDEVMIGERREGRWVQVTYWQGQSRLQDGGFERGRPGWVHSGLLEDCG